jgi:two-component system, OmpR family, heavy metal sensor histidine kinase CusS
MVSLLTLVVIAVLSTAAYIDFKDTLLRNVDTTLRAMAEGIRAELDDPQSRDTRQVRLHAVTGRDGSSHPTRYRIWMDGGDKDAFVSDPASDQVIRLLTHPPEDQRPDVGDSRLFNLPGDPTHGKEHMLRVLWMRYPLDQQVVNVLVSRSSNSVYHELGEFLRLLLLLGGGMTLLAFLLVPAVIAWGLRPIARAGERMERITHLSLRHEEQTLGGVPSELEPFKSSLDSMLARLNEGVSQQERLTADVAHELRTPLAIIKSTLQTLRMRPRAAGEYEEGIDDALLDVDRMERLVGQLLTLARLDALKGVADPKEVRLDLLLESLAQVFHDRAERQGGRVVFAGGTAVSVRGDEAELRQLFSNLLDNALRYGPATGTVRITLEPGPGEQATLCVHDEGGAIPPENLPHLFERFYRVDSSRSSTAPGGSGLGLAIVHEIVKRHHGDIAIISAPQAGTSVTVRLPCL